jgi:hypothetical protein
MDAILSPPLPCCTADNQLLKLPSTKFTVREREMLIGSGILPMDFFNEASKNPFALGLGGCGWRSSLLHCCTGAVLGSVLCRAQPHADMHQGGFMLHV